MSESPKAIFLSYASQDATPAKQICDALRAAGAEVWFDQSELRGGDAWDAKIRKQIKECALFLPVISSHTQARAEGYFRLEWHLAEQRSHLIARGRPFIVPICVDETTEAEALVPDAFLAVQWMRLAAGETSPEFCARVKTLLDVGRDRLVPPRPSPHARREEEPRDPARPRRPLWPWVLVAVVALPILYWVFKPRRSPEEIAKILASAEGAAASAAKATEPATPPAPLSEARQLSARARAMSLDKYNSTADDYAAAEGLIKRALELDANDGEVWAVSSLYNTLIRTRGYDYSPARRELARSQAERALTLAPDSVEGRYALARWQRDNDPDSAVAERTFQEVLARAPDHAGALQALATLYHRIGRFDEAIALFERAARQPDQLALARYGEFLTYFGRSRFADAERCVRESWAASPSSNSVAGLGMVLLTARGDAAGAVQALAAAPAVNRNEHRVVWMSAFAQLAARQPDAALKTLDRLSADFILDNWFTGPKAYWVGRAYAQAGRPEAARLAFESGLAIATAELKDLPGNSELRVVHAELLAWLGRTDEALREERTVAELERPGRDIWIASRARIFAALGRPDEALPLLASLVPPKPGVDYGWPLTAALLRVDPLWDKLRNDPRFLALCAEPAEGAVAAPLTEGAQLAARALALYTKVGFTRDDLGPAEDFARRATEKEPDSAAAWGVRAGVQAAWLNRSWDRSDKRLQETQALANRALALDPAEPEALLAIGHVLRTQGASDQAVAHLRQAVALHPDHVRLARALGFTLGQVGRDAESRVVLLDLSRRVPRDPLVRYELALAYADFGAGGADPANLATSLEQLDAALAIEPFASPLLLKAALLGGWRGDLAGMRSALDQLERRPLAERTDDRSISVMLWAGLIEHRPDRVEAVARLTARNYFEDRVVPMRPKGWSLALAHRLAGKENLARTDWQGAAAVLRERLVAEPGNNELKAELATTLAWLDQPAEAAALIAEVEPIWREQPNFRSSRSLALYYAAGGNAAKAVPCLRNGVDRNVFTSRQTVPLDPMWDKLRGQPEFEALSKELAAKP